MVGVSDLSTLLETECSSLLIHARSVVGRVRAASMAVRDARLVVAERDECSIITKSTIVFPYWDIYKKINYFNHVIYYGAFIPLRLLAEKFIYSISLVDSIVSQTGLNRMGQLITVNEFASLQPEKYKNTFRKLQKYIQKIE